MPHTGFLGAIGVDWKLLIFQIINFAILLLILRAWVYSSIIRRIVHDEEQLSRAEKETAELEKERKAFLSESEKERQRAQEEAEALVHEAEDIAGKIRQRAQEEAEVEKEQTIEQIHLRLKEIEDEKKS